MEDTYKLCHHHWGGGVLSCCNDTSWCHPSASDGEEPHHVIRRSRYAYNINWRILCQQLQPSIPASDVSPIDLKWILRVPTLTWGEMELNLRITWRGDALYNPILAKYTLDKMCFDKSRSIWNLWMGIDWRCNSTTSNNSHWLPNENVLPSSNLWLLYK